MKTFYNEPGKSYYQFSDLCEAINGLEASSSAAPLNVEEKTTTNFNSWRNYMKKEYFVMVNRVTDKPDTISVVNSISGKYKIINYIGPETCK